MSGTRVVVAVEKACKHGYVNPHVIGTGIGATYQAEDCPGGFRRTLTPETVIAAFNQVVTVQDILVALGITDHTEGTS